MKLAYVKFCGFRGYSKPVEIEFSSSFTVIDGRNGVGKSSVFDAVEFTLLGSISKYGNVSTAGETVDDYIWWRGPGSAPSERFVEVGFALGDEVVSLRRTMINEPDPADLQRVTAALMSENHAPDQALKQLCTSTIIRDEQIAELSLDLKEGERFKKLRNALGASDAEQWIRRASHIHDLTKKKREAAQEEVTLAAAAANSIAVQIEETRRSIPDRSTVDEAMSRLRAFAKIPATSTAPETLRAAIVDAQTRITALSSVSDRWFQILSARAFLSESSTDLEAATKNLSNVTEELNKLLEHVGTGSSQSEIRSTAETYGTLLASGEAVGLRDDHCPLCAAARTPAQFEEGLARGRDYVARLDEAALERAKLEHRLHEAQRVKQALEGEIARLESLRVNSVREVEEFTKNLILLGFDDNVEIAEIERQRTLEQSNLQQAQADFAVVDSLRLSATLETHLGTQRNAQQRRQSAEEKLGVARKAESRAKLLFDAARRTAGEVLDERLEIVMPLMSEFYRRLRPHPIWEDIDYKLRGDVQRYLRLQVGEDINPQFIYSSGQRRATGLAFLLSVNLSLSWNNWKSLMLDDPVQHIDDFRSVHLAEVLAKILGAGRQVICAAEDEALADLLVRHLSIEGVEPGKRITLGVDADGALAKTREYSVAPMPQSAFAVLPPQQTAS